MGVIKGLVIAAPFSGGGKTTLACGLIAALRTRGLKVAPFKVGPDYIDPGHLSQAAGRPCYNLDPWMTGEAGVWRSFSRGAQGAEVAIIEGVMGLFDGTAGQAGSTAQVAKLLGLPILLVFPADHLGATAAALVRGLLDFDPSLNFLGVVLTKVASSRHERLLTEALHQAGIPLLGVLPRQEAIKISSRHLGLFLAAEATPPLLHLQELVTSKLDMEALLRRLGQTRIPTFGRQEKKAPLTVIACAKDEAFAFYYQENLDLLEEAGAQVRFFSPLRDPFPPETKGLYLGGGYPELYAAKLAAREDLRATIRTCLQEGMPVLAECGGFMFLQKALRYQGEEYPMVGALERTAVFGQRLQALGYRRLQTTSPSPLGPAGLVLRGHEFRYSSLDQNLQVGFSLTDAWGQPVEGLGMVESSFFTSYVHVHFGSCPEVAKSFVRAAQF